MFHSIEFISNETVAVVPQSRYNDGDRLCPCCKRAERVDRGVKNAEKPGTDWKKYESRVLTSYGTLIILMRWGGEPSLPAGSAPTKQPISGIT